MYKLAPLNSFTQKQTGVIRLTDTAYIPLDLENTDYQEYLAWVSEGGIVQEAD